MAIGRTEAVLVWADRWRDLRAWKRSLDRVRLSIRSGDSSTGRCWPAEQRIAVTAGPDMPDALATVLHELAHAAVSGDEHHGPGWQACFAAAVEEVTGIPVVRATADFRTLDLAALDAMRAWWRLSGEEQLWRLARGA